MSLNTANLMATILEALEEDGYYTHCTESTNSCYAQSFCTTQVEAQDGGGDITRWRLVLVREDA